MSIGPQLTVMLQRIFDDASTHLMQQYKQCSVEETGCMYRDGHGNSCAIGGIIKDEFYDPALECMPAIYIKVIRMISDSGYGPSVDLELIGEELNDLQCVHDGLPVDRWFSGLHRYAIRHNLNQDALIRAAETYDRNMD